MKMTLQTWFLSLTLREQNLVKAASAIFIIFMLYLFIVDPISSNYLKNKKNVETASKTVSWMKAAATEVKRLGGSNALSSSSQGKFALSTIDRSIKKAGLGAMMKRVQPEGETGVRVWFENAAFDELIAWLASIELKQGLSVNEINIEQTETTGLVNVRVYLESS
ncbi:MAG: type II secretion system protein M [Woeseiaceae bacterium]